MYFKELSEETSDEFSSCISATTTSSQPLDSRASDDLHHKEREIRRKLQWYFKTPFEKYKSKGRKPYKFLLQIIKIVVITVQATFFAVDEFSIVHFNNDNVETFRSVFFLNYDGSAVKNLYTKESMYSHMLYAWKQYYNFDTITVGLYERMKTNTSVVMPIRFCKQWDKEVRKLFESQVKPSVSRSAEYTPEGVVDSSDGNRHTVDGIKCYDLKAPNISLDEITLEDFVLQNNLPATIGWVLSMKLTYSFKMNYSIIHRNVYPDCYKFNVELYFDNHDLDGIMTVTLNSHVNFHMCHHNPKGVYLEHEHEHVEHKLLKSTQTIFDIIVVLICLISMCLCMRSFAKHYLVYKDSEEFFKEYRHEQFKSSDKIVFVSLWLVLIVLSDLCALAGSVVKFAIDWLDYPELYTVCSIAFGLAVVCSWIGVLRYLGFMKGYNTLLVTLKVAFPSIIRFVCCCGIIYIGFVICGWIVFGPYHPKFSSLFRTSECLFSLLNGDDMYNTFVLMTDSSISLLIYYFGKVYLYVFISLFIFVVLSLFIAIVSDTFEKIKDRGHAPRTRVELFMEGLECEGMKREASVSLQTTSTMIEGADKQHVGT